MTDPVRPFLKRSRWWVINEGNLFDALVSVERGEKTAEQVMIDLLKESEVEREDDDS